VLLLFFVADVVVVVIVEIDDLVCSHVELKAKTDVANNTLEEDISVYI